ncbi:MAG: hypothetical protein WC272_05525 [Sulfurimonas sp.]|jgi:hypothetical protein
MKKKVEKIIVAAVAIGVFLLMLLGFFKVFGYILELDNDDKKKAFLQSNQEFICRDGYDSFLVSNKNGWSIEKDKFVKEDKIVSISRCNKRE